MTISPKVRAWCVDVAERVGATFAEAFLAVFGVGGLTSLVSGHLDRVLLTAALSAGVAAVLAVAKGLLAAKIKGTVSPASLAPEQQPGQALQDAPGPAIDGPPTSAAVIRTIVLPERPVAGKPLGRVIHHDERSRAYAVTPQKAPLVSVRHQRHTGVFDQGTLGSCFPPGVRVRMADSSERPIEQVRLGEHVVTAEGGMGRVVRTLLRDETGGLHRVALWGHAHLRMTREHPVLTARGYVEARNLRIGDEVALPRYFPIVTTGSIAPRDLVRRHRIGSVVLPDKIELTPDAGRLFGLWLAEGSADGTKVRWHYGGHEAETLVPETIALCASVLGADVHAARRPNGTWWVTLYGTPWNALFKILGGDRVDTKRPHPLLTSGSHAFLEAMLDGWLAGDGCYRKDGAQEGVTVSADLALAMYDVAQAAGRRPVIDHRESPQNRHAAHRLPRWTLTMGATAANNYSRQDEAHVWRKVRALTVEDYVGPVYDLTIEGDHSYVAEGVGVHNCTGNACAGALSTAPFGHRFTESRAVAIYKAATRIDDVPGQFPPDDTGSSGLAVAKVAKTNGWCSSYRHCFNLDAVLTALQTGPVMLGVTWLAGFDRPAPEGRMALTGPPRGGHEIVADEIDVENRRVWIVNSWGLDWARSGRAWWTWDDLATILADYGDATVLIP